VLVPVSGPRWELLPVPSWFYGFQSARSTSATFRGFKINSDEKTRWEGSFFFSGGGLETSPARLPGVKSFCEGSPRRRGRERKAGVRREDWEL